MFKLFTGYIKLVVVSMILALVVGLTSITFPQELVKINNKFLDFNSEIASEVYNNFKEIQNKNNFTTLETIKFIIQKETGIKFTAENSKSS